jgi:AbrB family looped-hinge helix DNA binding protein
VNIVTTSAKGQVVIPKKERKQLGIKPGSRVIIEAVGDHIEIRPVPDDPIEFYCGIFRQRSSLTGTLLQDKRREEDLEDIVSDKQSGRKAEKDEG